MTWPSHSLLGVNSLWLLALVPPEIIGYDFGTLAACAVLGALMPDLDASQSKIKHLKIPNTSFKPFLFPAQFVHRTDQHRGLLHSLWELGMAAFITLPLMFWVGWAPVVALVLGYASHLIGDAATKSGIRFLYPNKRRFYILPQGWRVTTGSWNEEVLFPIFALGVATLLLVNLFGA